MSLVELEVFSHHFSVTVHSREIQTSLMRYISQNLTQWDMVYDKAERRNKLVPKAVYAKRDKHNRFRFHINSLQDVKDYLALLTQSSPIKPTRHLYNPRNIVRCKFPHNPDLIKTPRDYQEPVIEYITKENPVCKLVELSMGLGKTFCTIEAMRKLEMRTAVLLQPKYFSRWYNGTREDIEELQDDAILEGASQEEIDKIKIVGLGEDIELEEGDVFLVSGEGKLRTLLQNIKSPLNPNGDLNPKVIIFSTVTLQNWFKNYATLTAEQWASADFGCMPYDLYEHLGVGFLAIDEKHESFHFMFIHDLYTNVPYSVAMSGTMISDDAFKGRMMNLMHPQTDRYKDIGTDAYITTMSLHYRFNEPDRINYTRKGTSQYNHINFEQSIMKRKGVSNNYYSMIKRFIDKKFFDKERYEEGDKGIVYCASIQMCTELSDYLKSKYDNIDIRKYTGGDKASDLYDPVIRVSTPGAAGTAIDIPGLTFNLNTVAIKETAKNRQITGRLRELKKREKPISPIYATLVNDDNHKHRSFHKQRLEKLGDLSKSHRIVEETNLI